MVVLHAMIGLRSPRPHRKCWKHIIPILHQSLPFPSRGHIRMRHTLCSFTQEKEQVGHFLYRPNQNVAEHNQPTKQSTYPAYRAVPQTCCYCCCCSVAWHARGASQKKELSLQEARTPPHPPPPHPIPGIRSRLRMNKRPTRIHSGLHKKNRSKKNARKKNTPRTQAGEKPA